MMPAEIRTQRLVLRPPHMDDLDTCAELLGDYDVAKMLSRVPYPYELESGRAYLTKAAENWQDPENADELPFHIDQDGQMIGCVSFKKLRATPEFGYWLGKPFWGKGYMSEAVHAATCWLFENTAHRVLAGEAMEENPASLKVLENIGFRVVGEVGCNSVSRGGSVPAVRAELHRSEFMTGH
ncbi:GNAT family N-acetyltransferase [Labrenzia sp. PHM005]|uniref:GNAT family N-acetyltransferase n=1 Tax=Labrenzia sp. PHM005 TaxID=2590016 RepID=UPI0011401CC1|nr:GNAT family N-acetyltransferase [Labrenzia sp. PHM005]QDG74599.1 GNAT family N-acetyltransferase [Labrenzia sp. PHM005]